MSTLTVGVGKQYTNLATAINAAASGDTILVDAGVYMNISLYINKNLTLSGVGGMAVLDSNTAVSNGKGYFATNGNVNIDHFEFRNAKVSSNNAAGIRYESGNLVIKYCYFHNNQNGLLAAANATGTITIDQSEFAFNGVGDGYTHNFYCNNLASLKISNSYFHDVNNGNQVKSRAIRSEYTNLRIFDNNTGANWEIDFPEGGVCIVTDCIVQQGTTGGNNNIMDIGAETVTHSPNSLTVKNCTFINDMSGAGSLLFNPNNLSASFDGCKIWKKDTLNLPSGMTNTTTLNVRPTLDTSSPWKGTVVPAPPPPPPPPPPSIGKPMVIVSTSVTLKPATISPAVLHAASMEPAVINNSQIEVLLHPATMDDATLTQATVTSKTTIDVTAFGVKSGEYSTRITMSDVAGGVKIAIDGVDCVIVGGITSSNLSASNFVFAS